MNTKGIEQKGIGRSISSQQVIDGWLDEMINLRHRGGRLQPVGHLTKLHSLPNDDFSEIWLHEQDGIYNYIGLEKTTYKLKLIDVATGGATLIKQYTKSVTVAFLKKFMTVSDGSTLDVFFYSVDDEEYQLTELPASEPIIDISATDEQNETSYDTWADSQPTKAEHLLGAYFARLNDLSRIENRFVGGMFIRVAYKLFDGNYILHSLPYYLGNNKINFSIHQTSGKYQLAFSSSKIKISIDASDYSTYGRLNDIISSVTVFACRPETIIEISANTITDDKLSGWSIPNGSGSGYHIMNDDAVVFNKFKEMPESASWYKIYDTDFANLVDGTSISNKEIDIKDFYQDYATRETLPVDNFSHHKLTGVDLFNYNSRLILTNVNQRIFPQSQNNINDKFTRFAHPYGTLKKTTSTTYDILFVFYLKINGSTVKIGIEQTMDGWYNLDNSSTYVIGHGLFGFPDSRAFKCEVYHKIDSTHYDNIKTMALKASPAGNFAFYGEPQYLTLDFESDNQASSYYQKNITYHALPIIVSPYLPGSEPKPDYDSYTDYLDSNRVQISELNNPFYFAAKHSYQVGTGEALASRTNTEPLSTGQFGEYPLIVFTSKGIWTLLQGQGDVLIQSIIPLNGEVPNSTKQITPIGNGVIYTTSRGLYLLTGRNVKELTEIVKGKPNLAIQDVENFKLRLNHTNLIQLTTDVLSKVDIKEYLSDALIGFDKHKSELLVTNENYKYSYVYSFESGYWHKISKRFSLLINSYPELHVLQTNGDVYGILDFSHEHFDASAEPYASTMQVVYVTRPCKIDSAIDFVLLHRIIQRCEIETKESTYAGFYVFLSNDLKVWHLSQGNDRKTGGVTDILCTRSHLKAKYFIFVFAADIEEGGAVNTLDMQYYSKLTNKLR